RVHPADQSGVLAALGRGCRRSTTTCGATSRCAALDRRDQLGSLVAHGLLAPSTRRRRPGAGHHRLPARPPVGHRVVPSRPARPPRGVRRPPRAPPGRDPSGRTHLARVPDLRGGQRRPRLLRVRAPPACPRALHHRALRARRLRPPGAAGRPVRLLRRRGLPLLLVEPPGTHLPPGTRRLILDRLLGRRSSNGSRRRSILWRWRRFFFVLGLGGVALVAGAGWVVFQLELPEAEVLLETSYVCAADVADDCGPDNAIAELSGVQNRTSVTLDQVPDVLIDAVL